MSTRATYQIGSDQTGHGFSKPITYYIHSDGYEEGAAVYFWNMHHCPNQRGSFADAFLRANDTAEITGTHDTHGDTEYHYTLADDGTLTVSARGTDWDNPSWNEPIFSGHYAEFINQNPKHIDGFEPLHPATNGRWQTKTQIEEQLTTKTAEWLSYVKRFPTMVGNHNWARKQMDELVEALAEIERAAEAVKS